MKTKFLWLAIFFVVILFVFDKAYACVCVIQTTCEFSARATTIFVGKVVNSKIEERDFKYSDNPKEKLMKAKFQVSRIQVKEAFWGLENENEIFIETDNYSSCFFALTEGTEYVIYANKDIKTGKYSTGFCSGTKSVDVGKEDLEYLRSQKNASGSSVKGFVGLNTKNKEHLFEILPNNFMTISKLGISTVLLENKTNKYTANIGENSRYEFQNIPQGKYELSVVLPKGYRTLTDYSPAIAKELGIELGTMDLTGFGCNVSNFTFVKTVTKKRRK